MTDITEVPDSELTRMAKMISDEQSRRRSVETLPERLAALEEEARRAGLDIAELGRQNAHRKGKPS